MVAHAQLIKIFFGAEIARKAPGSHHRSRGAILILMLSFSSRHAAFRFLATQAQARTAQMAAAAAAARTP